MNKPKAVVFDLGKVLLDFDYSLVARKMAPHCSLAEAEVEKVLNQSTLLFRYETGHMTTGEFFEEVRRLTSFCQPFDTFEPIFGDIFTPVPGMIALNDALRRAGVPTFIFSNTNEMAVKHIRGTYPFFREFDGHIYSYEHRAMKPDLRIYEVVERHARAQGAEILYIDDRLENVEAGAARGWQTIHHTAPGETIPRVKTLAEIE